MPLEVVRLEGNPVSVRLSGHEFPCEDETGETIVPKKFLTGFQLSEIPKDITIKPVESIEGHVIHMKHDIGLSQFSDGLSLAVVEEIFRRKFWDGEVGLSPYVAALRQAVDDCGETAETDFQDDGDYVFLHYEITIDEDLEIQEGIRRVEGTIKAIHERADQLVSRHLDELLGIFDRGSFDADLNHALGDAKQMVALIMADIDHFKQVNDTHGHRIGDGVLRTVAQVLATRCSTCNGVPYRYGGEELAVIVIGTDAQNATAFAEWVRADVEKLSFEEPGLKLTVSLGVATAPRDGNTPHMLIKRADFALYRAKRDGRNCVRTAETNRSELR